MNIYHKEYGTYSRFMELSYPRTFVNGNVHSIGGTFIPWNFRSWELLLSGTFVDRNFRPLALSFLDTDNY